MVFAIVAGAAGFYVRGGAPEDEVPRFVDALTVETFDGIIELDEILSSSTPDQFEARVGPGWEDMTEPEKHGAVKGMVRLLSSGKVYWVRLLGDDGDLVAEWEDGVVTVHD